MIEGWNIVPPTDEWSQCLLPCATSGRIFLALNLVIYPSALSGNFVVVRFLLAGEWPLHVLCTLIIRACDFQDVLTRVVPRICVLGTGSCCLLSGVEMNTLVDFKSGDPEADAEEREAAWASHQTAWLSNEIFLCACRERMKEAMISLSHWHIRAAVHLGGEHLYLQGLGLQEEAKSEYSDWPQQQE